MTSRKPTEAMEELWTQLRALGVTDADMPTARTLENWKAEGLVATRREFPGRGHGSRSHYVEGTAAKVADLINLLKERRSLDRARLVLFYRGHDIEERALKRSYVAVFRRLQDELRGSLSPQALSAHLETSRSTKRARKRLTEASPRESLHSIIEGVASNIRGALLGESVAERAFAEVAEALGIPAEHWQRLGLRQQVAAIDSLDLEAIAEMIDALSLSQLQDLRDTMRLFAETPWAGAGLDLGTAVRWDETTLAAMVPVPYLVALYQEAIRQHP
jgi:DNA-binding PadR family transcriptional regulator